MTNTTPSEVRGAALLDILRYAKANGSIEEIIAACPEPTQKVLGERLRGLTHYPYHVFPDLLNAIDKLVGQGDLSECEKAGAFAARSNLQTKLGFFVKLYSNNPSRLIRSCGHVWQLFFRNAGEMKTIESAANKTLVRITNFDAIDRAHCRYMFGWMTEAMAFVGAKVLESEESACIRHGDSHCEFKCSWTLEV